MASQIYWMGAVDDRDDTARVATSDEVKDLRHQARDLKEFAADLTLEKRLLKKA